MAAGPASAAHAERSASLSVFASEHSTSARKKSAKDTGRRHGVRHRTIVVRRSRRVRGYQRSTGAQSASAGTTYVAAATTCAATKPRGVFVAPTLSQSSSSRAAPFASRRNAARLAR